MSLGRVAGRVALTFSSSGRWAKGGVAALATASVALAAPSATKPVEAVPHDDAQSMRSSVPASGEMAFVVTQFAPPIHRADDDCPEGLAGSLRENYLNTLPAAERLRLLVPASEAELTRRWKNYASGPDNANICSNVELFDRPPQKTLKGKVARGLNLDGGDSGTASTSDTCEHENFQGPNGEAGIDNQAYRAMGCTRLWRGTEGMVSDVVRSFNGRLATGEDSMVLLLRDVQSLKDDNSVDIIFATTDDRPPLDSKGGFITGASFTTSKNLRWRNVLHGRIVDGVLITDPADMTVSAKVGYGGPPGLRAEWLFKMGRFRLAFQPDGSIQGILGAYQTPRNVIQATLLAHSAAAIIAGIDCAAEYATLKKLADGMRDPKTGQCTAVSTAFDIAAVPAFVIDRPTRVDPLPSRKDGL